MDDPKSESEVPDDAPTGPGFTPEPELRNDAREATASAPATPRPSFKRRHWGKLLLLALILLPVLVFSVWTFSALNWSYLSEERAGFVHKIARKGIVCKTWEGTIYTDLKGFRSDSFQFTVRSDSLAHLLESLNGSKVAIRYEQHVGVPTSCFGESEFFVTEVRALKN